CTSLPQLAAEVMGVSFDHASMTFADTAATPFDIGSHASRTLYAAGTAVVEATRDARKQVLEYAADLFKVAPERLVLEDGVISAVGQATGAVGDDCTGTPLCKIGGVEKKSITLKELAYEAHLRNKQFIGVGRIVPENAPPWHAHFAEVEVDTELCQVRVLKIAAVHDVGKAIHPIICEGQIEGGVLQGIGYALSEEIKYDEKGRQLESSLHKYMLPTADDVPEIEALLVEANDPTGPFGAKGVGECGLVPTAPAITNAIYDATGIRFYEIPVTEEKMFKALKEHAK
ncbi:MAG: molybdopterin-dependent oxidoreductase, partial [Desulfotomaculaceae bacterium]|nr:molybdopterin-dependent oxidoreductase [Desulfotomaculaceae bacterium]